jgi:hypothetical protein
MTTARSWTRTTATTRRSITITTATSRSITENKLCCYLRDRIIIWSNYCFLFLKQLTVDFLANDRRDHHCTLSASDLNLKTCKCSIICFLTYSFDRLVHIRFRFRVHSTDIDVTHASLLRHRVRLRICK